MKSFNISILSRNELSNKAENDNYQSLKTIENKTSGIYKDAASGEILISGESDLSFESLVKILELNSN